MSYDDWLAEPYEYPSRNTAKECPEDFLDSEVEDEDEVEDEVNVDAAS